MKNFKNLFLNAMFSGLKSLFHVSACHPVAVGYIMLKMITNPYCSCSRFFLPETSSQPTTTPGEK